ncbi:MBG domain-containing protein [Pedobacter sp. P351]|uniref:MBG domain-containing protein n=1 Tax=Pedobacter superstes TaxID=3133441 RepID=UPI0030B43FFE
MKNYFKLIVLVLFSYCSITGAQAQLSAGTEGLYIKAGTTLSTDGLVLSPSADLSLSGLNLEKSAIPVTGAAGFGINRAYNFRTPVSFSGTLGFYFLTGELNGNAENILQLVYKSSGVGTYTATTGTSVNTSTKYLENTFPATVFSTVSAADPAIFTTSANANLSALALSAGTLSTAFSSGILSYTASVANNVSSLTLTSTGEETHAIITINGTTVSSGSASGSISLSVGSNTLTTVVTAQDGTTTKTYTISLTRADAQTIAFNPLSAKSYGDADFTLPATASSGLSITYVSDNTSVATISGNTVTVKDAGTVKITASQAGNSSYDAASPVEQILVVNKKAITITAAPKSKSYGETDPALIYSISSGALAGSDAFTGSLSRDAGENAGIYPIKQGTLALNGNYDLTYAGADLSINKIAIAITAAPKSKAYGDTDPALIYSITSGALIGSDAFTGSLSRDAGESAGIYLIRQGTLVLTGNYDLTYTGADLSINKIAITVSAAPKSKAYGDADPALIYSITSGALIGSDAFTGSLSRDAGESAGIYPIRQGTLALTGNYDLTYSGADLSIGKKSIMLTANPKSKAYGEVDPALTYSITSGALAGSDTFTGSLIRDAGENAGTYTIKQGTLTLNGNYSISFTVTDFTISKKALSVIAEDKSKMYGDANMPLTVKYTGLVNGETTLTPAPVISTAATALSSAGTYDIEAIGTSVNYSITFVKGTLRVDKKLLTVTADNKTRIQNTVNPPFTVSYSGFIAGEGQNNLTTQPIANTTAGTLSALGAYQITVSGGAANNYSFIYTPGMLTITPGIPTSVNLAVATVYENAPAGTLAGTLSSTSDDGAAAFTYSLTGGSGSVDNGMFNISGNQIRTAAALDFEQKSSYTIRVRSATQHNLTLDKELIISLNDVNEQPGLNEIANQVICYTSAQQSVGLSGITAGPEAGQSVSLSVSSTNNALFESLEVTQVNSSGNAQVNYKVNNGSFGTALINVLVTDNGGTANSGINSILKSFIIEVNPLPQVAISSDKGLVISKGETALLTATGGGTYQWQNAQGILGGQINAALFVRPEVTTTYKVLVKNASNCTTEQEVTITVNADYELVSGTNIMSPNGDGVNDNLIIKNLDMYPKNEVKIFDRAGRLLYSQKNYTDQWDGTLNGSPLAQDTYYYVVDFGQGIPQKKGFVSIIRD